MAKEIAVQSVGMTGGTVTTAAVDYDLGMKFLNDGKTRLYFVGDATANTVTVTITANGQVAGNALDDATVSLDGSAAVELAGPFPPQIFNTVSGTDAGCVCMTFTGSGTADYEIGVFK